MEAPVQPITPPPVPKPSAPAPAPVSVPPTPTPAPVPAAVPPSKPPVPPPPAAQTPSPAAQTPTPAPRSFEPPKQSRARAWIKRVILAVLVLFTLGLAALFLMPFFKSNETPTAPTSTSTLIVPPIGVETPPTSGSTSTPAEDVPKETIHALGETVQLFENDSALFASPTPQGAPLRITATDFTDLTSVTFQLVTEGSSIPPETFSLTPAKPQRALMGVTVTLVELDEGKGGPYAMVRVK